MVAKDLEAKYADELNELMQQADLGRSRGWKTLRQGPIRRQPTMQDAGRGRSARG
jgi:hypothetical protein